LVNFCALSAIQNDCFTLYCRAVMSRNK